MLLLLGVYVWPVKKSMVPILFVVILMYISYLIHRHQAHSALGCSLFKLVMVQAEDHM